MRNEKEGEGGCVEEEEEEKWREIERESWRGREG